MRQLLPTLAVATLLAAPLAAASPDGPAPARAATGTGGGGTATTRIAPAAPALGFAPGRVVVKFKGQRSGRAVGLPPRIGVREAATALRRSPRVAYAEPDYIATASTFLPNDTGTVPATPGLAGGWMQRQWNFLPWQPGTLGTPTSPGGIDAVGAWRNLIAAGRPGAKGVTVAVLDTGIAYRNLGKRPEGGGARFRRSPDFSAKQFVPGYNFVENNPRPVDTNGHGTHVAGTIAEETNNGVGLTGLAYKAKLMPVQVLNSHGRGQASEIAKGIRFATQHGAQVINMSFNFGCGKKVPDVDEALRLAAKKGIVLVASVGNVGSETCISPPATEGHVIGVGGATQGGCLGSYSLAGEGVDVLAPGGGAPIAGCPSILSSPIYQVTLKSRGSPIFGTPGDYIGTSMAAAHVSGVAAMTIASGVLGKVSPRSLNSLVTRRLKDTARSLGLLTTQQGAGLIDAAKATELGP
ncbi:MAG TPA: S8 family serine peptidase [Solirubrobacterales bacterium]|jgi:serine protease|nr:S8 family serine peptidase [Solirubrobacterales bacterium]